MKKQFTLRQGGVIAALALAASVPTTVRAGLGGAVSTVDADLTARGFVDVTVPAPAKIEGQFMNKPNWSWYVVLKDVDGDGTRDDVVIGAYHKVAPDPSENVNNRVGKWTFLNVVPAGVPAAFAPVGVAHPGVGDKDWFQVHFAVVGAATRISIGLDHSVGAPAALTGPIFSGICAGATPDCDSDGILDACESDCGENASPDACRPGACTDVARSDFLLELTGVPTVSEWGLIAMTLLVLAAGTLVLRRGQRATA